MNMTLKTVVIGSLLVLAAIVFVMVILPYADTNKTTPSDIFRERSPVEAAGRTFYIANGCVYCHSQSIRKVDWGLGAERIAQAGDYLADHPILLGSARTGPDLSQEGGEHPDDWQITKYNEYHIPSLSAVAASVAAGHTGPNVEDNPKQTALVLTDWESLFGLVLMGYDFDDEDKQYFIRAHVTCAQTSDISVSVTPDMLWPPNHKMVEITADVVVSDCCNSGSTIILTSITSNEPDDAKGNGDGNTVDDIQGADFGTEDYDFLLRAERAGSGDGRIYTITYTATDASGNSASASATVTVPHDQGKKGGKK